MSGKITEKQWSFLVQLVEEKDLSSLPFEQVQYLTREPKDFWQMSKQQASNAISLLLKCPKKPVLAVTKVQEINENVPEGRYFIVDPTDNVEKFFRVKLNKPQHGDWAGHTFQNLDVQASDYFYPIKDIRHKKAVLAEIEKDPITAMNEYGIRLEICGRCGRKLTKRSSRLKGIGPICEKILYGEDVGDATDEDADDEMLRNLGLIP